MTNSFKVYRLWESQKFVLNSLLVSAAKRSLQNTYHLNWLEHEDPVRKVWLQSEEDLGEEVAHIYM